MGFWHYTNSDLIITFYGNLGVLLDLEAQSMRSFPFLNYDGLVRSG